MGVPTGTVTFLFTDIEGSVKLAESFPEAAGDAVELQEELLQHVVDRHGGYVFGRPGDGLCVAFQDPADAVRAALEAQSALQGEDWAAFAPGFGPLRVRMGLHTGTAVVRRRNYYGRAVNRAARVTQLANGDQVIMTSATQRLVREELPPNVELRDLGFYLLPELGSRERIYQVVGPSLRDLRVPLRSELPVRPHAWIQVLEDADGERRPTTPERAPAGAPDQRVRETLGALREAIVHRRSIATLAGGALRAVAEHRPADMAEYRLTRVAQWAQPRHRLDERFVELSLLVDQGESQVSGRWTETPARHANLGQVLAYDASPALVLLGPPGSGKTTILQHEELATAAAGLCSETEIVPFFARLSDYGVRDGDARPRPLEWLSGEWRRRYGGLGELGDLLEAGRVLLLLDGLNEMPCAGASDYRHRVGEWKAFLREALAGVPGNRAVFTCRSLDYSSPLSSQALPVPQVRIELMDDAAILRMLRAYSPVHADEVWDAVSGSKQLEILRTPYMLRLLVTQVDTDGQVPDQRAALIAAYVRSALQREIENDNPLFRPGELITERDYDRIVRVGSRARERVIAGRSPLLRCLGELAFGMQQSWPGNEMALVRVDFERACGLVRDGPGPDVLRAAGDLGILEDDPVSDEVMFRHQLLQEYFAARQLATDPDADLASSRWRADEVAPSLEETLESIAEADPLPPLPTTRWDETMAMTAAMVDDPASLIHELAAVNLVLAARCASEATTSLPADLLDFLRGALVERSRDPAADLRARIAAGRALALLGDPRFELRTGPHGPYVLPPMVAVDAGIYVVGSDDGVYDVEESPRHTVQLEGFQIARYPVTNAEWAWFMAAGGYDDERWWDTPDASAWRSGEGTAYGQRWNAHHRRHQLLENPEALERARAQGQVSEESYRVWREILGLKGAALERRLADLFPGGRLTEPRFWTDSAVDGALQPVVGICWFEARAYASWLSAQTGEAYRLPTEAEWEAAARGTEGRRYAYGDEFDAWRGNCVETHIRSTTPVGVFPDGDTPLGVADMSGNVFEWTSTLYGTEPDRPLYRHPYREDDGRERADAGPDVQRVLKGGSWVDDRTLARAATRLGLLPSDRMRICGARLARA